MGKLLKIALFDSNNTFVKFFISIFENNSISFLSIERVISSSLVFPPPILFFFFQFLISLEKEFLFRIKLR